MANSLDSGPLYDPISDGKTGIVSPAWMSWFSSNHQNLIGYLSQFGMFVPQITMDQRDSIQTPQLGQMIYNTTLDAPQIWQAGAWKTFTTF